jgi:hypothetical protein
MATNSISNSQPDIHNAARALDGGRSMTVATDYCVAVSSNAERMKGQVVSATTPGFATRKFGGLRCVLHRKAKPRQRKRYRGFLLNYKRRF